MVRHVQDGRATLLRDASTQAGGFRQFSVDDMLQAATSCEFLTDVPLPPGFEAAL